MQKTLNAVATLSKICFWCSVSYVSVVVTAFFIKNLY